MDASGWHDRESEDCVTDTEKTQRQRREELIRLSVAMISRSASCPPGPYVVRDAYSVLLAIDEILCNENEE